MSAPIVKTIRTQLRALHGAGYDGIVATSVGDLNALLAEIDRLTAPPTDDEREALAKFGYSLDPETTAARVARSLRELDALRRQAKINGNEAEVLTSARQLIVTLDVLRRQGPPTDDEREGIYHPALIEGQQRFGGDTARAGAFAVGAEWGFRRQGPITDAQVEAALNAWLHNDGATDHADMRAALEAARRES